MPYQLDATVAAIRSIAPSLFRMTLHCPAIARSSHPGNFVHILTSKAGEPFWRRAYSVHDTDTAAGIFEIIFKVVGRGTSSLSRMKRGNMLNLLGPLGNSFTLPSKRNIVALISGGVGVPPLHFLAKHLIRKENLPPGNILFFVGARTKAEHFCLSEMRKLKLKSFPATDDGSFGHRGFVTSCFEEAMQSTSLPLDDLKVYTCGPEEMLKEMAKLSAKYNIPCEASLETAMPCGIGACMGCAVKVKGTQDRESFDFKRVCKDGPVFPLEKIIWHD
ncbi:MAG: dihydroorotate dehydrogenase electron transfer subunit [Candidatus Zixiibacteriota bacterium]